MPKKGVGICIILTFDTRLEAINYWMVGRPRNARLICRFCCPVQNRVHNPVHNPVHSPLHSPVHSPVQSPGFVPTLVGEISNVQLDVQKFMNTCKVTWIQFYSWNSWTMLMKVNEFPLNVILRSQITKALHRSTLRYFDVSKLRWYSASSVIWILIIQHLDYPNAKFHKPHPHLQKPHGLGDCEILQMAPSNHQGNAECLKCIEERLDTCKLIAIIILVY